MRGVLAAVAVLALVAPVAAAECVPSVPGTTEVRSLAAAGDSITKGFNAHRTVVADTELFCPNADQEEYGWATSDTNGTDFCSAGDEGVFSLTERLECRADANVRSRRRNQARSGARMLTHFVGQAQTIRAYLCARSGPRLATVFLGHNDVCSGKVDKEPGCEHGPDEDPDDYCRTTPAAFEREFRKGLDVLVTLPDTRIAVASLVRVSQLCNHRSKRQCQTIPGGPCHELWEAVARLGDTFGAVFGLEGGICGSLTKDCEDPGRIAAAYHTARAYHDILERVTREYVGVPEGSPSPVVEVAGQIVGGATRAPGTTLVFSDAPWVYRFDGDQISCCDCFHPSLRGQNLLARVLRRGLRCSRTTPCCANMDDPRCSAVDRSGRLYPGFF
jgi:lysophospholipase L1-like esterase